jgi:hypothetical protein
VLKSLKETTNYIPGQPVSQDKSERRTSRICSVNADLYTVASLKNASTMKRIKLNCNVYSLSAM